jgi:hypothetical protein
MNGARSSYPSEESTAVSKVSATACSSGPNAGSELLAIDDEAPVASPARGISTASMTMIVPLSAPISARTPAASSRPSRSVSAGTT